MSVPHRDEYSSILRMIDCKFKQQTVTNCVRCRLPKEDDVALENVNKIVDDIPKYLIMPNHVSYDNCGNVIGAEFQTRIQQYTAQSAKRLSSALSTLLLRIPVAVTKLIVNYCTNVFSL